MTTFSEMDRKLTELENSEGDPVYGKASEVLIHRQGETKPISTPVVSYNNNRHRGNFYCEQDGTLGYTDKDQRDFRIFPKTKGVSEVPWNPGLSVTGNTTAWGFITGGTLNNYPYGQIVHVNEGQSSMWKDLESHGFKEIKLTYDHVNHSTAKLELTLGDDPWDRVSKVKDTDFIMTAQIGEHIFAFNKNMPVNGKYTIDLDAYATPICDGMIGIDSVTLGLVDVTTGPKWTLKTGYEFSDGEHKYGMVGDATINGGPLNVLMPAREVATVWNHHKEFGISKVYASRVGVDLFLNVELDVPHNLHLNPGCAFIVKGRSASFKFYTMLNNVGTKLRMAITKAQFDIWAMVGSNMDISFTFDYSNGNSGTIFNIGDVSAFNNEGEVVGVEMLQPITIVKNVSDVDFACGLIKTPAHRDKYLLTGLQRSNTARIDVTSPIALKPGPGNSIIRSDFNSDVLHMQNNIDVDWEVEYNVSGYEPSVVITMLENEPQNMSYSRDTTEIAVTRKYDNETNSLLFRILEDWVGIENETLQTVEVGSPSETPIEWGTHHEYHSRLKVTRKGNLILAVTTDMARSAAAALALPYKESTILLFDLNDIPNFNETHGRTRRAGFCISSSQSTVTPVKFIVPSLYVYCEANKTIYVHDINKGIWSNGTVAEKLPKGIMYKETKTKKLYRCTSDGVLEEV